MYRKIMAFINEHQAAGPSARSGMVVQSLCHFLHHELSEYHRLLAVLESQMSLTAADSTTPAEGSGLTLLRLGLWTEDMKLKLRLMETVVDDASCMLLLIMLTASCTWRSLGLEDPQAYVSRGPHRATFHGSDSRRGIQAILFDSSALDLIWRTT